MKTPTCEEEEANKWIVSYHRMLVLELYLDTPAVQIHGICTIISSAFRDRYLCCWQHISGGSAVTALCNMDSTVKTTVFVVAILSLPVRTAVRSLPLWLGLEGNGVCLSILVCVCLWLVCLIHWKGCLFVFLLTVFLFFNYYFFYSKSINPQLQPLTTNYWRQYRITQILKCNFWTWTN